MEAPTRGEVTRLLAAVRDGDRGAMDRLLPLVYDDLRVLARRQLRRQRAGDTLNTTALAHEAYLKMVARSPEAPAGWQDRVHFMAVAAVAMRQILVDTIRRRVAEKRGGAVQPLPLDEARVSVDNRAFEILALDEALTALTGFDERSGRVVELRFFGGLTVKETAEVLAVSERTVKSDWRAARAFLFHRLGEPGTASPAEL